MVCWNAYKHEKTIIISKNETMEKRQNEKKISYGWANADLVKRQ